MSSIPARFSHICSPMRGSTFAASSDAFMREKASDYFENTKTAIAIHREYGERNPYGFEAYSRDFWGVTAGDGPADQEMRSDGRDRRFFGYMSRGVPYGPDDGTVAPWAMLATLAFAPEAALAGTRRLLEVYPQVCRQDRFSSGFNPTLVGQCRRLAFQRMVRARPGLARDDDRKSSHRVDLGDRKALRLRTRWAQTRRF